jgi:uncharacterized iron-regulated membrane protein
MSLWQKWRDHPEQVWLRNVAFEIHFWTGAILGAYILLMSVSGSAIVFRDELYEMGLSVEPLVDLHENLLTGSGGRTVNGIGAIGLTLLCLTGAAIWWPGMKHWRRSLTVEWRASFARINWDLHSALGFWCLAFVAMWGLSGIYLVFPHHFSRLLWLDPAGVPTFWLTQLHFGRFNEVTRLGWVAVGLVPAVLAFTGVFICCRRLIFKKPSNPRMSH